MYTSLVVGVLFDRTWQTTCGLLAARCGPLAAGLVGGPLQKIQNDSQRIHIYWFLATGKSGTMDSKVLPKPSKI
jgi:hypothetical protein